MSLIKIYIPESRLLWNTMTEETISCVQILKVRVQCVVVDMHVDQPLQKKSNSESNVHVLWNYWYQENVNNQRVSVTVTTLDIVLVRRTLICHIRRTSRFKDWLSPSKVPIWGLTLTPCILQGRHWLGGKNTYSFPLSTPGSRAL